MTKVLLVGIAIGVVIDQSLYWGLVLMGVEVGSGPAFLGGMICGLLGVSIADSLIE